MKQIGTGLMMYTQDYDETLPQQTGDFGNFLNTPAAQPNWPKNILPYTKNTQIYRCPSTSLAPAANAALTLISYQGNGAVISETGLSLAAVPAPADIIFCQENFYAQSVAYNRPNRISALGVRPALYRSWDLTDCRPQSSDSPRTAAMPACGEQYTSRHNGGGNLAYLDGHAKWKKVTNLRSGDFGLVPDEAYVADLAQAYCNAGGTCGGKQYPAAF